MLTNQATSFDLNLFSDPNFFSFLHPPFYPTTNRIVRRYLTFRTNFKHFAILFTPMIITLMAYLLIAKFLKQIKEV